MRSFTAFVAGWALAACGVSKQDGAKKLYQTNAAMTHGEASVISSLSSSARQAGDTSTLTITDAKCAAGGTLSATVTIMSNAQSGNAAALGSYKVAASFRDCKSLT